MAHRVLFIDGETALPVDLVDRLKGSGCQIESASNAKDGIELATKLMPEVVVIGDSIADVDPLDLSLEIRNRLPDSTPPVFLMLTPLDTGDEAQAGAKNVVVGKAASGTNGVAQLIDRIAESFQRTSSKSEEAQAIANHGIRLDRAKHRATVQGNALKVTPTEFKLLWELVSRPGFALSRQELARHCKGSGRSVQSRTIDAHIKAIRSKLNSHADLIETVHGIGYRFREG